MRTLFVFALLSLTTLLVWSATAPNTPPDGSSEGHPYCMLESLSLGGGLSLQGDFAPNDWSYSCALTGGGAWPEVMSTRVRAQTMDDESSVEVKINGVVVHSRALGNALSNNGDVADSPRTGESDELAIRSGQNEIVVGVACNQRVPCYYEYKIKCNKPSVGGGIVGDPQFIGLRGQSYQVHGVSGEVYNIISDPDLQYNARFVFLDKGECPIVNGRRLRGCFSHPGSYLGELGLKTRLGDRIRLESGSAADGFAGVSVNGKALEVGELVLLTGELGSVSLNSTHLASVNVGNWELTFENSDMFINQRVRVVDARHLRSHGLIGQTWRTQTYRNAIKHIQGFVDDYTIRDGDMFGDSFVYNAFN